MISSQRWGHRKRARNRSQRAKRRTYRRHHRKFHKRYNPRSKNYRRAHRKFHRHYRRKHKGPRIYIDVYRPYYDPFYYDPYYYEPLLLRPSIQGTSSPAPKPAACYAATATDVSAPMDCRGKVYGFRARFKGRRYKVRVDARSGVILHRHRY